MPDSDPARPRAESGVRHRPETPAAIGRRQPGRSQTPLSRAPAPEVSGFGQNPLDRQPKRPRPMPDSDPTRLSAGSGVRHRPETPAAIDRRQPGRSQTPLSRAPAPEVSGFGQNLLDRQPKRPRPMPDSDPTRPRAESGVRHRPETPDAIGRRQPGRSQTPLSRAPAPEVSGFGQNLLDRQPKRPRPMPDSDPTRPRAESGVRHRPETPDAIGRRQPGRSQTPVARGESPW